MDIVAKYTTTDLKEAKAHVSIDGYNVNKTVVVLQ
jgi:hypothetical protein